MFVTSDHVLNVRDSPRHNTWGNSPLQRRQGCHYDRIYVSYSFLIDFFKVIAIQKLMGFLTKPNTEVVDGCCLRATVSTRAAITLVSCSGTQSSFTLSPCTCASYTRNLVRQYDNSQLNGVSDQEKRTIALWYYLFIYIWWLPSMHTTWTGDKRDQEWTQDFKGGGVGEGYHGSGAHLCEYVIFAKF